MCTNHKLIKSKKLRVVAFAVKDKQHLFLPEEYVKQIMAYLKTASKIT